MDELVRNSVVVALGPLGDRLQVLVHLVSEYWKKRSENVGYYERRTTESRAYLWARASLAPWLREQVGDKDPLEKRRV